MEMDAKTSRNAFYWVPILVVLLALLFGSDLYFRFSKKSATTGVPSVRIGVPIGRALKTITLSVGDFKEFQWTDSKVRIRLVSVMKDRFPALSGEREADAASINLELEEGLFHGGERTRKLGMNRFLLPEKWLEREEPFSVYAFKASKDHFKFFRLYVEHVDRERKQARINIFFFS